MYKEQEDTLNPFGTGDQKVTIRTDYWPGSSIPNLKIAYTEDGTQILYELYDQNGLLIAGWKLMNGIRYEWVLNDPNDPSKGGDWVEKELLEED
jgi:hypothetical protein